MKGAATEGRPYKEIGMWRRKLKARLLLFVVRKLRTWAASIERNVPQTEALTNQGSSGPPQHWLDLVREKAPELLSMQKNEPKVSPTAPDLPRAKTGRPDLQEAQEKQPRVVKESQAKPLFLKYAKLPSALRNRTVAKAKSLARSRFVTKAQLRKSVEEPPAEQQERPLSPVEAESAVHKSSSTKTSTTNRKVDLQLPPIPTRRSEPDRSIVRPETHSSSGKTMANGEAGSVFVRRQKGDTRGDHSSAFDSLHSRASRADQPESSERIQRQPTVAKWHRPTNEPTVRPSKAGDSAKTHAATHASRETESFRVGPARDTSEFLYPRVESHSFVTEMGETNERVISVVVPAQIDTATRQPATPPGSYLDGKRPARQVTTFTESSSRRPLNQRDHLERAEVNLPALLNEATMDQAAAAQWAQSVSDENPWPDLPSPSPLETEDDLSAYAREADHYRRLELEQRGTLWNE